MLAKLKSIAALAACALAIAVPANAQRGGPPPPEGGGVTPAEIHRMFDAYALLQAQEQLKVTDAQYAQFLARFKMLQDTRRQGLQQRTRAVMGLRQLVNDAQPDEAQIRERLKMLDDLEVRTAADVKKAQEAIDQILDVRQQAKFRIFEKVMERRKLELVTRARFNNRPRQAP